MLSLVLLYVFGWLISSDLGAVSWWPVASAAAVAVAGFALWRFRPSFTPAPESRAGRVLAAAARTTAAMAAIPVRRWASIVVAGAAKWVLDLFCLAAAATACHATLGWWRIAVIYLGIQIVRQIPLTPGGTGLIEVVMLAALVAAGCSHPVAAALVVLYRLISMWLVLLMGIPAYLWLRRDLRPER
jgi:putative heme transporter